MNLSELIAEELDKSLRDPSINILYSVPARLHECVRPLKWRAQSYKAPEQLGHHAGSYSIYESAISGKCVVSSGPPFFFGPYHYDTLEAAKAAAQAHYAKVSVEAFQ